MRQIIGMSLTTLWIVIEPATASAIGYGDNFMGWGSSFGLGHMFFSGAMMIAFWGVIVLLFVAIHRCSGSRRQQLHCASAPDLFLSDLNKRYARGDIDHDEFEKRRQTLLQSGGPD